MEENQLPATGAEEKADPKKPDPRLEEANRVLGMLEESEGADSLAPAGRLADLLEDLLEGAEGKKI